MIDSTLKNLRTGEELESELLSRLLVRDDVSPAKLAPLVSPSNFRKYSKHYETWFDAKLSEKNIQVAFNEAGIMQSDCIRTEYLVDERDPLEVAKDIRNNARANMAALKLGDISKSLTYENVSDRLSDLQNNIFELLKENIGNESDIAPLVTRYTALQDTFRALPEGSIIGIPCGLPELDMMIDGLRPGHLWIVAGYTNLGKSSLTLNFVSNVLKQKKRAVFFSLEMSDVDIISRMLGIMSRQNGRNILKGRSDAEEEKKELQESDFKIYTDKRRLSDIIFAMRECHMKKPVDAFFIDYIQQIEVEGAEGEYEAMRESATKLQSIAQDLGVPLVVVSQISNEAAKQPNSAVMGFKGAGTIASAADFAIEIVNGEENIQTQRQKAMAGSLTRVKVIIKKNRHGQTGMAEYDFDGKTGRFQDTTLAVMEDWNSSK